MGLNLTLSIYNKQAWIINTRQKHEITERA